MSKLDMSCSFCNERGEHIEYLLNGSTEVVPCPRGSACPRLLGLREHARAASFNPYENWNRPDPVVAEHRARLQPLLDATGSTTWQELAEHWLTSPIPSVDDARLLLQVIIADAGGYRCRHCNHRPCACDPVEARRRYEKENGWHD